MQRSDALGIKQYSFAISPDLFAVCLVSFLNLAIGVTVFQICGSDDFSWVLAHIE